MSFIDCVRLKSETDLFKPWIVLGVWQVFCASDRMGFEGGRMDAPFYNFAHEIGCNHAADQGAGAGLFSIRMAGGLLVETGRSTGRYCPISVSLMKVGFHFSPIRTHAMRAPQWGRPWRIIHGRSTKRQPQWRGIVRRFLCFGSNVGEGRGGLG